MRQGQLGLNAGLGGMQGTKAQARAGRGGLKFLLKMRGAFYRAFVHLKSPQAAEKPQGRKFLYYSEIYPAPTFILQN